MKQPGPEHPITITLNPRRVRVELDGQVIADSAHALTLQESTYPAVQYIPRADIRMDHFAKTDHHTVCPYKGQASYYSLTHDGQVLENLAWSYEEPYPAMAEIAGHLAFYANRVRISEV